MSRMDFTRQESRSFSPWSKGSDPRRILIIRLHAIGDVAITLPASAGLRELYPDARIDFLTSDAAAPLVRSLRTFDRVHQTPAGRRAGEWLALALRWGSFARQQKYDVILDLQRNWVTRVIRRMAHPKAWGEFDRYAPKSAADRVLEAFHETGFAMVSPSYTMEIQETHATAAVNLLREEGWDSQQKTIVLNPAGLWETRNWPLEHYVSLARLWLSHEPVRFLLIGTRRIRDKAACITQRIGNPVINMAEKTTLGMALALLQHASAVITEDSGLMHMAWCSGIPTVALFGSTRHVWSAPPGRHTRTLHSGDLPCGQCMSSSCQYGDVHCLTRYTPETVLELALQLTSTLHRSIGPR